MSTDIRPSPIAGTWYPGSSSALARSVDQQLAEAETAPPSGTVVGLIVPHAGHIYSGLVAACAFNVLRGLNPKIVAIVSPLHQYHPGQLLTTGHAAYATPLGTIPVHHELVSRLAQRLSDDCGLSLTRVRNDQEHSLEIELPFLQRVLSEPFELIPLMLRDQSPQVVESVGHSLAAILAGQSALLVASSDLSHFYPDAIARRMDAAVLARIQAFNPAAVLSAEEEGVGFACGRGAVAAVLWAARDLGADRVQVLRHATSGDVTGDTSAVVGYGAAVIYRATDG
jgi:AmmeMemoRadiSam system protein B